MKILLILPCSDENGLNKDSIVIRKLEKIISGKHQLSVTELDLSSFSIKDISVEKMFEIIEKIQPVNQFDAVHTFSILPFIFRGIFPQPVISSFDIDLTNEKFRQFIPENDEPGYARHDIASLDATAVYELYHEVCNNRKRFDKRPWGWWKSLVLSNNYKVKQIYVAPEAKLSLQTHKFRSELWMVAHGNGWVTIGDRRMTAEKGSVFNIGKGEIHRAEGGEGGLCIIELQIGDYLGEDDIIRIEDIYGRS